MAQKDVETNNVYLMDVRRGDKIHGQVVKAVEFDAETQMVTVTFDQGVISLPKLTVVNTSREVVYLDREGFTRDQMVTIYRLLHNGQQEELAYIFKNAAAEAARWDVTA